MELPPALESVLAGQHGLATPRQVLASGVTRSALRWSLGRAWRFVLPGVVATFTGELDPRQRLVAAQLWAGPRAQVAGSTALRWHGVGDLPDDGVVRMLVDWGQAGRRDGFALRRRTSRLDANPVRRGVLRICRRPRALVDAAHELRDPEAVRHLLVEATQRRQVAEHDLMSEVEAGAVRGRRALRAALRIVATGAWSVAEADVLDELGRSPALPRVWPNPRLWSLSDGVRLPSPDFWLDDVGLAGQLHSRRHHARDADWEGTVGADSVFAEYGVTVVAVTPAGFARDPAAFRRRVERAHVAARGRGRPAVRMEPRGPGVLP